MDNRKFRTNLGRLWRIGLALLPTQLQATDLVEVTRHALEQDQQLESSRLGVAIRQQQRQQSAAALLPRVDGSLGLHHLDNSALGSNSREAQYNITLTHPLYHRGREKSLEQRTIAVTESELALKLNRQQLLLRVAEAYFAQLTAGDNLRLAEQELRAVAEQLKQTEGHYRVEATALTDLQEVRARNDLVNAQRVAAEATLSNRRETLRAITARIFPQLQPLTKQELPLQSEQGKVEEWVETALQNNPTLQQLQQQVDRAILATEAARAEDEPILNLIGSLSSSRNSDNRYGADSDNITIGLQATLPLYQGGATRARITEATLLRQQTESTLEQQRREIVQQVRSTHQTLITNHQLVQARKQALASAQTAWSAIRNGVEVGTRTTADLLDAQRELYQAQRNHIQARYERILAELRLKQLSGVLTLEEITAVNRLLEKPKSD